MIHPNEAVGGQGRSRTGRAASPQAAQSSDRWKCGAQTHSLGSSSGCVTLGKSLRLSGFLAVLCQVETNILPDPQGCREGELTPTGRVLRPVPGTCA